MANNRVSAIVTLRGIKNTNMIKIKHLANVKLSPTEIVPDEKLDEYDICKRPKGVVKAKIYKTHITDSFLMSTKKLPMLYFSVILEQPLRSMLLYKIILYFTIQSNVKSAKELLGGKHKGEYSVEMVINDKVQSLNKSFDEYPGRDTIIKTIKDLISEKETLELTTELAEINEYEMVKMFNQEFETYKIPEKTVSLKDLELEDDYF